jgi:hypothetical protein
MQSEFEDLVAQFEVNKWFAFEPLDAPGCKVAWGCRTGDQGRDIVIRCSGSMSLENVSQVHPELLKYVKRLLALHRDITVRIYPDINNLFRC